MSKIIIGNAHGKNIGFDTDLLLAGRALFTADSGGGKSWVVRVLLEQTFGKVQTITIDPEGEFASLREKFPFVLAGKGGETPIDVRAAGMLAHRLLKLRAPAICDLYDLRSDLRHAWVKAFLDALIEAPKELRTPVIVVVDEAHMFCPEKGQGESDAKQSVIDVCTRGRKRGLCPVLVTQRLAMLDKSATSQLQNRLVGPTFEEVNVKTAVKLFGIAPGKDERDFSKEIRLLEPGNFFALGRAISRERILITVRGVETTHPKAFEKHVAAPPPTPEKIKALLPQLADLPKEAEQKVQTERDYKAKIRDLETRLNHAQRHLDAAPVAADPAAMREAKQAARASAQAVTQMKVIVEEAVKIIAKINAIGFDDAGLKPEELQAALMPSLEKATAEIGKVAAQKLAMKKRELEALKAEVNRLLTRLNTKLGDEKISVTLDVVKNEPVTIRPASPVPTVTARPAKPAETNGDLSGPEQKILDQLAELEALGITQPEKPQLGLMAGYTNVRSGGFSEPMGALVEKGLACYPQPGLVALTDDGRQYAQPSSRPLSNEELHARLCEKLGGPEGKLLQEVIAIYPDAISKVDLGARLNYTNIRSGGFSEPVGRLHSLGIVEYPEKGFVRAADWLFVANVA